MFYPRQLQCHIYIPAKIAETLMWTAPPIVSNHHNPPHLQVPTTATQDIDKHFNEY